MTTYAPQAAPGHWLSAAELAQESGLRADLIVRFLPANESGLTPLYSAEQIPLAQFVKKLTDAGTPAAAIDVAVRDLVDPAGAQTRAVRSGPARRGLPGGRVATALIALGVGALGLTGGLLLGGLGTDKGTSTSARSAPITVTAEAPPPAAATIPEVRDPACSDWAALNNRYLANGKRVEWMATDPNVPATEWSSQQRALTDAVIPTMKEEAAEVASLAERASAPALRMILQLRAEYEGKFAERLPGYVVSDHALWEAVSEFGNAANSFCTALAPR